mmetsp:Transcript_33626/g.78582  ORF Transcript_33626/g.78582 Transcript_33626/m.78582 type:complete len:210 (+) Transcript_33626:226-855(+)
MLQPSKFRIKSSTATWLLSLSAPALNTERYSSCIPSEPTTVLLTSSSQDSLSSNFSAFSDLLRALYSSTMAASGGSSQQCLPSLFVNRCGSKLLSSSECLSGLSTNRSHIILGRNKKSPTSQSSHMAARDGTYFWAARISETTSQMAVNISECWTYRAPVSQHSSQSTRRATNPTLLHKWGSTHSRQFSTSCRYRRTALQDSHTSPQSI